MRPRWFQGLLAESVTVGVLAAAALSGCAPAEPGADDAPTGDTVGSGADALEAPVDSLGRSTPEAEPLTPLLPGEGPAREYRVLIVNPLAIAAHVSARAGARAVILDTVAAHDSSRVDIRVRASQIGLEARDGSGARLDSTVVELSQDTLNRWVIGRDPTLTRAPDSAAVSLVPPEVAGYPRSQLTTLRQPTTRRR